MSAPAIIITITPLVDQEEIRLLGTRTGEKLRYTLAPGTLEKARSGIDSALRSFKETVGQALTPRPENTRAAFRKLMRRTVLLGGQLTGKGPSGMNELRDFFVSQIPNWATVEDSPSVQVEGPAYGFPFELLPVFSFDEPGHMDDLPQFARRYLGFTAAVRRVPYISNRGDGLPASPVLRGSPVSLSFAWYARMKGARQEKEFFTRLGDFIELNGPFPGPSLAAELVEEEIAGGLFDPRRRYLSPSPSSDVQVQHFACHCDTGFGDPADYEFEFCGEDGARRLVTLGDLNWMFARSLEQGQLDPPARPLVFLNACGSTHLDPRHVYSWPEWFLQTRHRAVIGPETLVPDGVAAFFAASFYCLLLGGRSAGQALVLARRELLQSCANPLGLLYVLYGDPTITIDTPIPQEVLRERCAG
jgi:hypothetical protein